MECVGCYFTPSSFRTTASVNGEVAHVGQSVTPGERVKVNGKLVHLKFSNQDPMILIMNQQKMV